MHDDVLGALCARGLNGAHGAHGEALLVHVPLLQRNSTAVITTISEAMAEAK